MSIMNCFLMLILDAFFYFLLTCYLEKVIPDEYGQKEPMLFFLMPSYWKKTNSKNAINNPVFENDFELQIENDFEPVPKEFEKNLAIT
jgi:hypothetical protein